MAKISCSWASSASPEDPLLEHVDPVVDRCQPGEEAVDEAVDDRVQEPGGIVDGGVALDVPLAQLVDRRRSRRGAA